MGLFSELTGSRVRRFSVGSLIPPTPEPMRRNSLELPAWIWHRLDEIADETRGERGPKEWHRGSVAAHFLEWAIKEYEAERAQLKRPKK